MSTSVVEFAKSGLAKKLVAVVVVAGLGYVGYTQFFPGGPSPVEQQATEQSLANLYGPTNVVVQSVSRVTDLESAKAAVPQITAETANLDKIRASLKSAHADGKSLVMKNVLKSISSVEAAQDVAYKIDGVEQVLKPAIGPFLQKLRTIGLP